MCTTLPSAMRSLVGLVIVAICLPDLAGAALAPPGILVKKVGSQAVTTESFVIPYAFARESTGLIAGVAGGANALPQPQSSLFMTGFASNKGALGGNLYFSDYQLPFSDRTFLDVELSAGEFPDLRGYFDPTNTSDLLGDNSSGNDDYFEASGRAARAELNFRYVFAEGARVENPINVYTITDGFLTSVPDGNRPSEMQAFGSTHMAFKLFYADRYYRVDDPVLFKTSGVELAFEKDRTDFPINPKQGNWLRMSINRDAGGFDSTTDWTIGALEFAQYIPLSSNDRFAQRTIALGFWTAETFSEDSAPPVFGVNLGGYHKLRAYPLERFSDRAAIYYSAELRLIPRSDWLRNTEWLQFADPEWWEMAAFVEVGRVAPKWHAATLHEDVKYDVGVGIRAMIGKNVGRMDLAWSDDTSSIIFMYGHPF